MVGRTWIFRWVSMLTVAVAAMPTGCVRYEEPDQPPATPAAPEPIPAEAAPEPTPAEAAPEPTPVPATAPAVDATPDPGPGPPDAAAGLGLMRGKLANWETKGQGLTMASGFLNDAELTGLVSEFQDKVAEARSAADLLPASGSGVTEAQLVELEILLEEIAEIDGRVTERVKALRGR